MNLKKYAKLRKYNNDDYMKTIKEYLNEGLIRKQLGNGTKTKIEEWLKEHDIGGYTINDDLTIDCSWGVQLKEYKEKELPDYIQFNKTINFWICDCPNLESLRGCPKKCDIFSCKGCPKLKSLEGGPEDCAHFKCNFCTSLKNLKGGPQHVLNYECCCCDSLESLEGAPQKNCLSFDCSNCKKLESLKGAPPKVNTLSVGRCSNIKSLDYLPQIKYQINCGGTNYKVFHRERIIEKNGGVKIRVNKSY